MVVITRPEWSQQDGGVSGCSSGTSVENGKRSSQRAKASPASLSSEEKSPLRGIFIHPLPGTLPAVAKTRQSGQQSCLLPRSSDPRAGVLTLPNTATL